MLFGFDVFTHFYTYLDICSMDRTSMQSGFKNNPPAIMHFRSFVVVKISEDPKSRSIPRGLTLGGCGDTPLSQTPSVKQGNTPPRIAW